MPSAMGAVAIDNGTVLVLIALIAIPFAAFSFSRAGEAYRSIGKGALSIDQDLAVPRYMHRPERAVDPAIQAAEVRQMLEAKAARLERHGEAPIDVGAETTRLLAPATDPPGAAARQRAELRAEVRQLVITRNERRMRKGLEPLDVGAETERQLTDFIGSA
jgi:leucyl aminopeptidase (aminopeptidase T)